MVKVNVLNVMVPHLSRILIPLESALANLVSLLIKVEIGAFHVMVSNKKKKSSTLYKNIQVMERI